MDEWIAKQCADYTGIHHRTWLSYVQRGQAPKAYKRVGNTPVWDSDTVIQWEKNRPHTPGRPRKHS